MSNHLITNLKSFYHQKSNDLLVLFGIISIKKQLELEVIKKHHNTNDQPVFVFDCV